MEFSREYYPNDILDRLAQSVCLHHKNPEKTAIIKGEKNPKAGSITFIEPNYEFRSDPYGSVAAFYRDEGYVVDGNLKEGYFNARKEGSVYIVCVSTGLIPELLPGIPIIGSPEHSRISVLDALGIHSSIDKAFAKGLKPKQQ